MRGLRLRRRPGRGRACCWTVATLALAAEDYLLLVEGWSCGRGEYAFTVGCAEPGFHTGSGYGYGYGGDFDYGYGGDDDDDAPVGGGMGGHDNANNEEGASSMSIMQTSGHSTLEVDRSRFVDNVILAFRGATAATARSWCATPTASTRDVEDAAGLVDCGAPDIIDYCPFEYCSAAPVGFDCYCAVDGEDVDPSLGSFASSPQIMLPVRPRGRARDQA